MRSKVMNNPSAEITRTESRKSSNRIDDTIRERRRLPERAFDAQPILKFTPSAWAKLQFFCHQGESEIGGFGLTPKENLLLIEEFLTVKQTTTEVSVDFHDEAVADLFETQVDVGRKPEQFARIWLHTHPGDCPNPSMTDEETFERVFGRCDWAVMFILARTGKTYARLRFNVGPGGNVLIPVQVDYGQTFKGSDHAAWLDEYGHNVQVQKSMLWPRASCSNSSIFEEELHEELESLEAQEDRMFRANEDNDLADLYDCESEVWS